MRRYVWLSTPAVVIIGCTTLVNFEGLEFDESVGGAGGAGGGEICGEGSGVVYVSPAGDDEASGLAPECPRKSIAGGIAAAKETGAAEVRVCEGSYDETQLLLDAPVSLLGGFACEEWERSDAYGFPVFDGRNETIIRNNDNESALRIAGEGVTSSVLVDGFTIRAVTLTGVNEGEPSRALIVSDDAAPRIENCLITGGAGESSIGTASIGVNVEDNAFPEIVHNLIIGGDGVTSTDDFFGSVGIQLELDAGGAYIHENLIDGGSGGCEGSVSNGSAGIVALGGVLKDTQAILLNVVNGGSGTCLGGLASAGIVLTRAVQADVGGNYVSGGEGSGQGRTGIAVSANESQLLSNLIYGGSLGTGRTHGVLVTDADDLRIVNNMIYGANRSNDPEQAGNDGIAVFGSADITIHHNTIFLGPTVGAAEAFGISLNDALSNASIKNNIVFGPGAGTAMFLGVCPHFGPLAALEGNAFAGVDFILNEYGDTGGFPCDPMNYNSLDQTNMFLAGHTTLADNVRYDMDCMPFGDPLCIEDMTCDITQGCALVFFGAWDAADHGYGDFTDDGWHLAPSVPCTISELDVDPVEGDDFYATMRDRPVSRGAHEQLPGMCVP